MIFFSLTYETPEGEKKLRAKSVVFTQPACVVADTVRDIAPESAKSFEKFYYPPVASVTVAYKRDAFRLEGRSALPEGGLTGFGQLHPANAKKFARWVPSTPPTYGPTTDDARRTNS